MSVFLEIDRSCLEEAHPLVIDGHIRTADASPIASLDHQMMGVSGAVEDLSNVDIGNPFVDAL